MQTGKNSAQHRAATWAHGQKIGPPACDELPLNVQACQQRAECIQVYKSLENTHPMPAVRRQAADIRYILEAPKLQLSPDEYVKIPILENADRYQ